MGEPEPWQIAITGHAERDLKGAPAEVQERVSAALDLLAADPGRADIVKLQGQHEDWRLRVGTWRVRFRYDAGAHIIVVLPRRVAYRRRSGGRQGPLMRGPVDGGAAATLSSG